MIGTNRFAGYQEENRRRRIELIESRLKTLAALRIQFLHITQLAETVAEYISEKETEAGIGICAASTLLRNHHYKRLLVSHLDVQARKEGKHVEKSPAGNGSADMEQIHVQLRCINLENENARLKAYIKQMEQKISPEHCGLLPSVNAKREHEIAIAALRTDYAQTCKTLLLVLKRFEKIIAVDRASNSIVDPAIKRGADRVIAGPEQAGAFCRWLDLNPFPNVGDN